jgi:fused signal recognition particle receptor
LPAETVAAPEADTVSASTVEKEDAEAFAADVVEVTEQVVESELPHSAPVTPAVEAPAEAEETPAHAIEEAAAAELLAEEVAAGAAGRRSDRSTGCRGSGSRADAGSGDG